ncbi:unnamed protein product, partial [Symbiodinium microadriaticum]
SLLDEETRRYLQCPKHMLMPDAQGVHTVFGAAKDRDWLVGREGTMMNGRRLSPDEMIYPAGWGLWFWSPTRRCPAEAHERLVFFVGEKCLGGAHDVPRLDDLSPFGVGQVADVAAVGRELERSRFKKLGMHSDRLGSQRDLQRGAWPGFFLLFKGSFASKAHVRLAGSHNGIHMTKRAEPYPNKMCEALAYALTAQQHTSLSALYL